jgi:hypothetical protein
MSHVLRYRLHLLGEVRTCLRRAGRDLVDQPGVSSVRLVPVRWVRR